MQQFMQQSRNFLGTFVSVLFTNSYFMQSRVPWAASGRIGPLLNGSKAALGNVSGVQGCTTFVSPGEELPICDNMRAVVSAFCKFEANNFNLLNSDLQPVGAGVYLVSTALNHSCAPNAVVVFDGPKLFLRATKRINAGEEVWSLVARWAILLCRCNCRIDGGWWGMGWGDGKQSNRSATAKPMKGRQEPLFLSVPVKRHRISQQSCLRHLCACAIRAPQLNEASGLQHVSANNTCYEVCTLESIPCKHLARCMHLLHTCRQSVSVLFLFRSPLQYCIAPCCNLLQRFLCHVLYRPRMCKPVL